MNPSDYVHPCQNISRRAGSFFFLLIPSQIEWNRSVIRHTLTQTHSIRQYVFAVKHNEMSKPLKPKKKKNRENYDDYQDGAALQETLLKQTLLEAIKDAFKSSKTHTNTMNSTLLRPRHAESAAGPMFMNSLLTLIMKTAPFLPAGVCFYTWISCVCVNKQRMDLAAKPASRTKRATFFFFLSIDFLMVSVRRAGQTQSSECEYYLLTRSKNLDDCFPLIFPLWQP